MTQEDRFNEFKADISALTYNDIKDVSASAYMGWLATYGYYVKYGGATPPHKPGTNG